MRFIEELRTTTNNYVFNRVRIPYDSQCGYCGCGHSCASTQEKYYHVCKKYKNKYSKEFGYYIKTDNYEIVGRFPNWKLVSKNKKQWMNKKLKKKFYNKEDYEIKW